MYEPDNNEEAIEHIPLKNLPNSGLYVFKYDAWTEGDPTRPNNVLISLIDELKSVCLVGRKKDEDGLIFASSTDDVDEIISDLQEFIDFLKYSDRLIRE